MSTSAGSVGDAVDRLRGGSAAGAIRLSGDTHGRAGRHVSRYAGGRSVSMARGRQLAGNGEMGRGTERGDVRVSREDSVSRTAEDTSRAAVQLSQVLGAVAETRSVLLLQE